MTSRPTRTVAPVIVTERLRLRGHTPDDLDAAMPLWSDPIATRFIGGRPYTREEVWQRIQRYAGSWTLLGHGFWAIDDIVTGKLIGEIGVMDAKREIDPPIRDELEMGWALATSEHGKGFASEALRAALGWVDETLGRPQVVALISPDNAPSLKLAERHGFAVRDRTTYRGEASIVLQRAGATWSGVVALEAAE